MLPGLGSIVASGAPGTTNTTQCISIFLYSEQISPSARRNGSQQTRSPNDDDNKRPSGASPQHRRRLRPPTYKHCLVESSFAQGVECGRVCVCCVAQLDLQRYSGHRSVSAISRKHPSIDACLLLRPFTHVDPCETRETDSDTDTFLSGAPVSDLSRNNPRTNTTTNITTTTTALAPPLRTTTKPKSRKKKYRYTNHCPRLHASRPSWPPTDFGGTAS